MSLLLMKEAGYMTYAAASHQGAINMICVVMTSIFIYSLLE